MPGLDQAGTDAIALVIALPARRFLAGFPVGRLTKRG